MNYVLYSTIYRVRNITCGVAKIFAWILGIKLALLYGMGLAADADALLVELIKPILDFTAALVVMTFSPRVFDAVLRRIAASGNGGNGTGHGNG